MITTTQVTATSSQTPMSTGQRLTTEGARVSETSTIKVPIRHNMNLSPKRCLDTKELVEACTKIHKSGDRFVDAFRRRVLALGSSGFVNMRKIFNSFDLDGDEGLNAEELATACEDLGLELTQKDFKDLFEQMDLDNDGAILFSEFVQIVRPPMGLRRQDLVLRAFSLLDRNGQTSVTLREMTELYDPSQHPAVIAGKRTEDEIMTAFIADWDRDLDTIVTKTDFMNYFADISANIVDEDYFELMMRNAWHMSGGEGACRNTTCLRVLVTFEDQRQRVVEVRDDLRVDPSDQRAIRDRLRKQGLENITKIEPTY